MTGAEKIKLIRRIERLREQLVREGWRIEAVYYSEDGEAPGGLQVTLEATWEPIGATEGIL